jgi:hypothetical protein
MRLRQHGTFIFFCTKNLYTVQIFCAKEWNLQPCRRRIGLFVQADVRFGRDRVTCVINTSYAVTNPKGNFASGRAEQTGSFSRNFGSKSQNFVKKIDQVPRCRRRVCRSPGETPGLHVNRVTRVINYSAMIEMSSAACGEIRAHVQCTIDEMNQ